MINYIHIKNCFKHKDRFIRFDKGLVAITGANEAGKSLIFEMIAYALFGSAALRGKAEDYKALSVTMEFVLNGETYTIKRTAKDAKLDHNGAPLVRGTKPVNAKIPELLGYNLKVFEIANYAKQNDLTALSDMKPTERKSMVDNVIGLDLLDDMLKEIGEKQAMERGVLDALGTLPEAPVSPIWPETVPTEATEESLHAQRVALTNDKAERDRLHGFLEVARKEPVEPEYPEHLDDYDIIDEKFAELTTIGERRTQLQAITTNAKRPELSVEEAQAGIERWNQYQTWETIEQTRAKLVTAPEIAKDVLEDASAQWIEYEQYLLEKQQWDRSEEICCPECGFVWKDTEGMAPSPVEQPAYDKITIQSELLKHSTYELQEEDRKKVENFPREVDKPSQPLSYYHEQLSANTNIKELDTAEAELRGVEEKYQALEPYRQQSKDKEAYDYAYDQYEAALDEYQEWKELRDTQQKRYEDLLALELEDQILLVEAQLEAVRQYKRDLITYENAKAEFDAKADKVRVATDRLENYGKARAALKNLRTKVKKYLVPSLNKVASNLLSQMTNGERQLVQIDENFDVLVDGQRIQTLSGSGKAVANLAIRIGLGQVLINKKFSLFMADEIDGDMDETRAAATNLCLQRLTTSIDQFLLISHKKPEADHYVEL